MKYKKYLKLVIEKFPKHNFDKIPYAKPEMVKKVAECLFISKDIDSVLAKETRHQLNYLISEGVHNFDRKLEMKNCTECENHEVISDPDPHDWFCSDDKAVICIISKNKEADKYSKYLADRSDYRPITTSCRPYNIEKECEVPKWCPLTKF